MKKYLFFTLGFFTLAFAVAQEQKIISLSNYDYKKFHFGMALDFGYFNLVNE